MSNRFVSDLQSGEVSAVTLTAAEDAVRQEAGIAEAVRKAVTVEIDELNTLRRDLLDARAGNDPTQRADEVRFKELRAKHPRVTPQGRA